MKENSFTKPHFFLNDSASSHPFTSPSKGGGGSPAIPSKDRPSHSRKLRKDLQNVTSTLSSLKAATSSVHLTTGLGIQVEFESFPDVEMSVQSLANDPQGIVLHNVKVVAREGKESVVATAFVPEGKLAFYEKKLAEYESFKKNRNNQPLDHQKLIDSIKSIRSAQFSAIWADDDSLLPENKEREVWWEVWLSTPRKSRHTHNQYQEIISDFSLLADTVGIIISDHKLRFPEHTVIQIRASQRKLEENVNLLFRVSEIRYPKITADFFDALLPSEQREWSDELLKRLNVTFSATSPYVCIIDSGVNVEHPLLSPFTRITDQRTVTEDNDPTDMIGHGTAMAGLAMWGDLTEALSSSDVNHIGHRLESVKTLRFNGDNIGKSLGIITQNAVSEVEYHNPERSRIYSMSLSSGKGTDRGRPSSWSSAMDSLAVDYLGEGALPRLFTVCAGNVDPTGNIEYPELNYLSDVHDPAQAWNVLTIGAYTEKDRISESSDYVPVAPIGGISPYSTTSLEWERKNTPIKPEVVFEGGNVGRDEFGCAGMQDLQLLTTYNDFSKRYFQCTNATSAANALAARFTAQIKSQYPHLWPETVRALTVHSADWTDEMYALISAKRSDTDIKKADMAKLVRKVGFGVPNIIKALNSASNSLSLVIQDELQPFTKPIGQSTKTNDMNLHDLPWPIEELYKIGEADVELTVTLSYFIEPNPSSRSILNKYSYASHQLRFDVKHHDESDDEFMRRINAAADGDKVSSTGDNNWTLGTIQRHRGSIHKDIWKGSAADLAARGKIAIYPASGWWKTRNSHERYDSKARYALIVSLSVPNVEVDLYSEIQTKIDSSIITKITSVVEV
ncbi:S8 family peptidase [Vibrio cholerae]|uniref:S8 family peptidase n=1 Tax=Vibrio TaxID=662 RepID=UPI000F419E22|nr:MULTISPECIES: S8 family peptidase [Vibrio]EGR4210622.1 S8 family peptidase [Vibrio cholerae]MDS1805144.1 S8 family peptidase [Vibrio vulnificus]NOE84446.1 S8 family peptidase [Vibrio cholerae]NOE94657.1 S8 family peptidase [Vibrio cholerae]NOE99405.1 S8 family peptidase [Vibrio cholerae]